MRAKIIAYLLSHQLFRLHSFSVFLFFRVNSVCVCASIAGNDTKKKLLMAIKGPSKSIESFLACSLKFLAGMLKSILKRAMGMYRILDTLAKNSMALVKFAMSALPAKSALTKAITDNPKLSKNKAEG